MNWAPLTWINPKYEVSSIGLIRSTMKGRVRLIRPTPDKDGYLRISLICSEGKPRNFAVHRLVLQAFSGIVGDQVNHKDGDKRNNVISNLEWCTGSENVTHAFRVLNRAHPRPNVGKFGAANPRHTPVAQYRVDGALVKIWESLADAARQGFNRQCIGGVCNGRRKTHKGFIWQYVIKGEANE